MNTSIKRYTQVEDRELLVEFRDALTDQAEIIEHHVAELRRTPDDSSSIAALFRAFHTIKGDATICRYELGVKLSHPIESLLARLRAGEVAFSPLMAEAILLALDRLELAVETMLADRPREPLRLDALLAGLDRLGTEQGAGLDTSAIALIEAVTGFRPATAAAAPTPNVEAPRHRERADDLAFFQSMALLLEARSPLFKGRTERLLRLASETNLRAGRPIDPVQLEAAVYLHDIGMMFLPEPIWLKVGALSDAERETLKEHPGFGAGLLQRMAGWEDAASMVAQHHEMADGRGYPRGLKDNQIVAGAKILAIVDAFEAVTLKHSHRGAGRSLLRAIAEINASDNQFSSEWIAHFNGVIRRMVEG